jgi:hypothetical protein
LKKSASLSLSWEQFSSPLHSLQLLKTSPGLDPPATPALKRRPSIPVINCFVMGLILRAGDVGQIVCQDWSWRTILLHAQSWKRY